MDPELQRHTSRGMQSRGFYICIYIYIVLVFFEVYEDAHGKEEKQMQQALLLPHEIVGAFASSGNLHLLGADQATY